MLLLKQKQPHQILKQYSIHLDWLQVFLLINTDTTLGIISILSKSQNTSTYNLWTYVQEQIRSNHDKECLMKWMC